MQLWLAFLLQWQESQASQVAKEKLGLRRAYGSGAGLDTDSFPWPELL